MKRMLSGCWLTAIAISGAWAQPPDTIYDEALVPAYSLPDPLLMLDGTHVDSAAVWANRRRLEVLRFGRAAELHLRQYQEDDFPAPTQTRDSD